LGKLLHPFSLVVLPAAWRNGQVPVVASAVMHWRMVKPPAENGAVRDSQYRGKVVQNVPLSGSQMPEHGIYRTETWWLQDTAAGRQGFELGLTRFGDCG